ncbi:MAG: nucleotidyltransferase family protein [Bacteroidia bacterium]|nr:nucleotidyltransferase family protein [Bacteroidia bacterium]
MSKRAVILAGGTGTRLRPYTVVLPKPLMPIGEYPILEVIVRQLAKHGFDHITMAVNHQAELIKAFFGNGAKWDIAIEYSLEDKPLGTMGPLRLISDLPENFLVMNGDILTDLSFGSFYDQHVSSKSLFSISSHKREQIIDYGVLEIDNHKTLIGFREKPRTNYEVSMGIYAVNRKALEFIPDGKPYGFDNLMIDILEAKQTVKVKTFSGYWLDIGRPEDYMQAIEQFESMKKRFIDE